MNELNGENDVIVFDNLYRPTDIVGDYENIKAKSPVPFQQSNAAACLVEHGGIEKIGELGATAGARLKAAITAA